MNASVSFHRRENLSDGRVKITLGAPSQLPA